MTLLTLAASLVVAASIRAAAVVQKTPITAADLVKR
jgi:hypothetical protein